MSVFTPAYWVHRRAEMRGDSIAIITKQKKITYLQLDKRVHMLALAFRRALGLRKGDRVAFLGYNSPAYVETIAAASADGIIAVPLSYRLEAKELNFQIKDSGAKVVFTDEAFLQLAEKACKGEKSVRIIPNSQKANEMNYDGLIEYGKKSLMDSTINYLPKVENGDVPLLIVYTSGTTGRPKGAVITNSNMFWNAINDILGLGITYRDTTLTLLPMFHLGGINLFTFPTLLAGGTVVLPEKFDVQTTLSMIEKEKVSIVFGVPTMYQALLEDKRFHTADLTSVRIFYSGGAPLPVSLAEQYRARGLPIVQGMGLTETSPTAFLSDIRDAYTRVGSVGKPSLFCQAKVVDEAGKKLEANERGEILISGPDVFKGYWKKDEETRKVLKGGWLHTGDIGYRDEEGYWYVIDRKKDMINSGGEKVYPSEVEEVLRMNSKVHEVAVIGVPDEKWGEVPKAIVIPKEGEKLSREELSRFCEGRLAKFKRPKYYAFVKAIPITASGKVVKKELAARYGQPKDEEQA
ncbi:MAG: long-chain fatty acid--CoA ligase [Conexivisphaerales archaeon]